jgi:tetraacyldisaccharide 4'-kinase
VKKIIAKALSSVYRVAHRFWKASYLKFPTRVHKVDAKVISVGNITWGGTGKTPFTVKIAQWLTEEGKKVAVLTRGYG